MDPAALLFGAYHRDVLVDKKSCKAIRVAIAKAKEWAKSRKG